MLIGWAIWASNDTIPVLVDGTEVGTKLGKADGGATFENKLPLLLGTLVNDIPGDGNKEADEDVLLLISKK